jgi:hypothetical protein
MKGAIEGLLRILATVIGVVGALMALLVVVFHTIVADARANGLGNGHFPTGLLMFFLALIGALVSYPFPVAAAVLMVLAAIGLFLIAPLASWFAIPFLLIAAILAFLDRNKGRAAARQG